MSVKYGQVYMCYFEGNKHEQIGYRPAIIIQNDIGNTYSPNTIVIPVTSSLKKLDQPTHVFLPKSCGFLRDSMALCESQTTVSKSNIGKYITTLPENIMAKIAKAVSVSTPVIKDLNLTELINIWHNLHAEVV